MRVDPVLVMSGGARPCSFGFGMAVKDRLLVAVKSLSGYASCGWVWLS